MRGSYRLRVRAADRDPGGAARVLLSGTGSGWAALMIVDVHGFGGTPTVPAPGDEYVVSLSPDPECAGTEPRC